MTAILSVMGLYSYDATLFDTMLIPDDVDKDDVISEILSEASDMEILYPNCEVMKALIEKWSKAKLYGWNRINEALKMSYSPIENTDKTEEVTESYTRNLKESGAANEQNESNDTNSDNGTTTNKVSAFNEDSPKTAEINENSNTYSGNTRNNRQITDEKNFTGDDNRTRTVRMHGNIGVTTNQEMITDEIILRTKYNIAQIIANDFICKFCIPVY